MKQASGTGAAGRFRLAEKPETPVKPKVARKPKAEAAEAKPKKAAAAAKPKVFLLMFCCYSRQSFSNDFFKSLVFRHPKLKRKNLPSHRRRPPNPRPSLRSRRRKLPRPRRLHPSRRWQRSQLLKKPLPRRPE